MAPFHRPRRLETRYLFDLEPLLLCWGKFPKAATLEQLFERMYDCSKATPFPQVERLAHGMVTAVAKENAQSWRVAASKSTQGKRIFDLLRTEMQGPIGQRMHMLVRKNAQLIRSLPDDIAQDVVRQIATRQMRGERPEEIAKELAAKMPEIARSRVQLLARTEVAKASEAITRARSEALNLNWYQWLTAEDVRVRTSHRKMDLVLVNWSDPPSPEALSGEKNIGNYNAGGVFNCRCASAVIVDLDQVHWPAKVYRQGGITRMSRAKFSKIAGVHVER